MLLWGLSCRGHSQKARLEDMSRTVVKSTGEPGELRSTHENWSRRRPERVADSRYPPATVFARTRGTGGCEGTVPPGRGQRPVIAVRRNGPRRVVHRVAYEGSPFRSLGWARRFMAGRVPRPAPHAEAMSGGGAISTLAICRSSAMRTTKRCPARSSCVPASGTRPISSTMYPPNELYSSSSGSSMPS